MVAAPLLDSSSGCAWTHMSRSRSVTGGPFASVASGIPENGRRPSSHPPRPQLSRTTMTLPRPAPGTARWWVVGVVGISLGVAVVVWYGLATTVGAVQPVVTAYRVESDRSVVVEYDLHRPQGTA